MASERSENTFPDIVPLGIDGLLVRFAGQLDDLANRTVLHFAQALENDMPPGVGEISTSLASVYVRFDPARTTRADMARHLNERLCARDWFDLPDSGSGRCWHVPIAFGGDNGPQLHEVAALTEQSEDAVIRELLDTPVRVLAIGFAPGQPYLGMLPERWDIPRQSELTPTVPAGALITAVRQLVLFTAPAPTGWRQIGRSAFQTFRPGGETPIPLLPGDMMRFLAISEDELAQIERNNADGSGGARLEVAG